MKAMFTATSPVKNPRYKPVSPDIVLKIGCSKYSCALKPRKYARGKLMKKKQITVQRVALFYFPRPLIIPRSMP